MACNTCSATPTTLLYACSGAADVGEISDRTARALTRKGLGKMSCAVGVGAGIQSLRNAALSAGKILAIDGCATRCMAKAMAEAGVTEYIHLELGTEGFAKGATPVTQENIDNACRLARTRLATA
jgi:uncharacterized metal-binding protein